MTRNLVLISWDGKSAPLGFINQDAEPDFDIIIFDYSGSAAQPETTLPLHGYLSQKTECKGQIFTAFRLYLASSASAFAPDYDYVALIDDDIAVGVAALNGAIKLASDAGLDCFSLALTPDSHVNHQRFIAQPGSRMRSMPWVEVMMPFYRHALFMAAGEYFEGSVSSYGIDQFAMPLVCKTMDMDRVALIDAFMAGHYRPVTSDGRVYSNGLTAYGERIALRQRCLADVRRKWPHLIGTRWFYSTFAPLNGPVRFWSLYLAAPWHTMRRLVSM